MASHVVAAFGFAIMAVILTTVLGAVDPREKYAFALGVLLIAAGASLVTAVPVPEAVSGVIALIGFTVVVGSTVPLLRGSSIEA
jgi:hypothetical protein